VRYGNATDIPKLAIGGHLDEEQPDSCAKDVV